MQYQVLYRPSFAVARVELDAGEVIRAEPGAMVSMSPHLKLESKMQGGLLSALGRSMLGGESMFQSTYTAEGKPGEILLAPSTPGDIMGVTLSDQSYFVQGGSYLAGSTALQMDTKFGGLKTFFAGEGAFMLKLSGTGLLLLSSFGAIHKIVLAEGEDYIVDTGHIVAFEASVKFDLQRAAKGLFANVTSGEGVVCKYHGPGEIYIQTRNLSAFVSAISPMIPKGS